jgi:hypothetical protein
MTTPKVKWCDYENFNKPTQLEVIHEAEAAANAAAQDPAFSEYLEMKIHDPIHKSRIGKDRRDHVTVRLQSQKHMNESTYQTAHIYVDDKHLYCNDFIIYEQEHDE